MISAVTAKSAMHFTTFTGKMNSDVFIADCRDLLHDDGGSVILIRDDLRNKTESALLRRQRLPELVREFFKDPCLNYVTKEIESSWT